MITVIANGHKQILEVKIKEEVVDPEDIEMLQDLVLAATNDALKKADELSNSTMGKFTKGLNLPVECSRRILIHALSRTNIKTNR